MQLASGQLGAATARRISYLMGALGAEGTEEAIEVAAKLSRGIGVSALTDRFDYFILYAQNALGELKRTELNRLLLKFGDTAKWEIRAGGEVISNKSGLSYGFDGKDGNKILHVLAHTVDKTKLPYPKTAPHSVFSIPNDELFDWIDDAWINRGLPDPSDLSGLAFNVNVSPKIVGTIGETGITNSR